MKYPLEIYKNIIKSKAGTSMLSVEAHLTPYSPQVIQARESNGKESFPLVGYSPFSVFKITLVFNGKSCTCNLKPDLVHALYEKTRFFYDRNLTDSLSISSKPVHKCFSKTFPFGTNKGKTPAVLLLEKGMDALLQEKNSLQSNLSRFPANKELIDACEEALRLHKCGELNLQDAKKQEVSLFDSGLKTDIYHPLKENGQVMIINGNKIYKASQLKMAYLPGNKNPFYVSVSNVKTPAVINQDGTINALLSQAIENSKISLTHYLSADECITMVSEMKEHLTIFRSMYYAPHYKLAWSYHDSNRNPD